MLKDKNPPHRQHGFTLIEVMIALFIFLVIMLGLAQGQLVALKTHTGNLLRDEALRLAEDELTRLKGLQFSTGGSSSELAASGWSAPADITVNMRKGSVTFARATQITDLSSTATALKRIDVAVGWTQGKSSTLLPETNHNRQTSLSTIIVRND